MLSTVRESRPLSPRSKKGKEKVKEVRYWQDQAGEEVLSTLSSKEKKKQEVIFELIQTEESYLKDLEVLYSHFYIPIEKGLIPVAEKETFLSTTFGNLQELISLHKEIVSNLKDIQKKAPVLKRFGTLFLQIVGYLNVYISYNANYPRAKLMLEKELDQNDAFYSHYENQMKNPMCRKLPLESFLSIGTTRLPRYKLYLETMLSKTETTDSDWEQLETAILKLSLVLEKIDREAGKTTNRLTLDELSQSLIPKKGQKENIVEELRLEKEEREFLFEGKVDRLADIESEELELKMILLDNFLILAEEKEVKEKKDNRERREKKRTLKLFCDPIPIELMAAMEEDEMDKKISELNTFNISFSSDDTMPPINPPVMRTGSRVSISGPSMVPRIHRGSISFKSKVELPQERDKSVTMAIHSMLNNKYHRLAFPNSQEKGLWRRAIDGAIFKVRETWEINFFGRPLGVSWDPEAGVINSAMKCDDPVSKEECLFVAATTGVYRAKILPNGKFGKYELIFKVDDALKVRARKGVSCLFVLAGEAKRLYAIPFANLHSNKKINLNKSEFKVSHTKGTSHFQIGHKKNRIFVCCVRTKETLASSAKLVQVLELEPYKNFKKTIGFFSKIIKEFPLNDEPRSVRLNVFPNAVCILGNSSLQLVDFTTGISREIKPRFQLFEGRFPKSPKRVFRLENDILLCFSELALFLKPNCEPSRPHAIIWKGNPTSFALHGNKILAFSPLFVEVYDLESGQMTQMIHFSNAFHLSENDDSNPEEAILISSVRDGQLFLQQVEYVPAEQ